MSITEYGCVDKTARTAEKILGGPDPVVRHTLKKEKNADEDEIEVQAEPPRDASAVECCRGNSVRWLGGRAGIETLCSRKKSGPRAIALVRGETAAHGRPLLCR